MSTKIDIINKAYARMRISGLTVNPTPEDIALALDRLESMAASWASKYDIDYDLEEVPQTTTPHMIPRRHWAAFETCLAMELIPDFGKEVPPQLMRLANAAYSRLTADYNRTKVVQYPQRQPLGSGTARKFFRYTTFYKTVGQPLAGAYMAFTDDIQDFEENFSDYLEFGETVASYVLTADSKLTVATESLSSPIVSYRLQFDEESELEEVIITITTSTGRKETRKKQFVIRDADSSN